MATLGALGDLVLALSADTAKFESDLGRAHRVGEKFGRDVARALGSVAAALTALAGSAGVIALVKSQIDAADAAGKLSEKVGLSTEQISAYIVQGKLANVTSQQLQAGWEILGKNAAEFGAGTGRARAAFEALGITQRQVLDLNGNMGALFELVAGKLAQYEDSANKSALATKILGSTDLIPLINSLEKTRKEAELLGRLIDQETAASAERFNDNLTRVGIAVQGFGLHIAKAVLPTLESFSERMADAVRDTERMEKAGRTADAGLRLLMTGGTIVGAIFTTLGGILGGVAAGLVAMAKGNYREAFNILTNAGADAAKNVSEAIRSIEETWDDTANRTRAKSDETGKKLAAPALVSMQEMQKAAQHVQDLEEMAAEDRLGASEALKNQDIKNEEQRRKQIEETTRAQVESAELMVQQAEDMVSTWDQAGNRIEMTRDGFAEFERQQRDSMRLGRDVGAAVGNAFEDIALQVRDASDAVRALEQDIVRLVFRQQVTQPVANFLSGSLGGLGLSTPSSQLGEFAEGGRPPLGLPSLIGERGPELFVPDMPGTVVPAGEFGGVTIYNGDINITGTGVTRFEVEQAMRVQQRQTVAAVLELQRR